MLGCILYPAQTHTHTHTHTHTQCTVHVRTAKRYATVRATDMWSETKVGWDGLGVLSPSAGEQVSDFKFVTRTDGGAAAHDMAQTHK